MTAAHAITPSRGLAFRRGLALPLLLLLLWAVAAHWRLVDPRILVPPLRVFAVPFDDPNGQTLWLDLAASLARMTLGFTIGASIGAALGLLIGTSRWGERLVAPSFNTARQVTVFAWIPLLTAWFGEGESAKLVFIALSALFPVALNVSQGFCDVPIAYRELAAVMRLPPLLRLKRILLPSALPAIFVGIEIALISAWLGTVGAEYAMGMGRGLGTYLAAGRENFRMDIVLVGVVALALTGWAMNLVVRAIFRRLARWRTA